MEWYAITGRHILSILSAQALSYYESWVKLMPQKAERLEVISAGVVSEFRTALLSNPLNVLDPDPQKLPHPCVRYAESMIIGALHREMDKPLSDIEQSQLIRAEITLRTFYTRALLVTEPERGIGFPTYNRRRRPVMAAEPSVPIATVVAVPTFDPAGGEQTGNSISVVVTSATPGAVIRYTVDGSEPLETSPAVFSGTSIVVSVPGSIKARAFKQGLVPSVTKTAFFTAATAGLEAYFHSADQVLADGMDLAAWAESVPAGSRGPSPAAGTAFALTVKPGTANLVIAYPANVRVLSSAVQQSTGMQVRLAWINSPYSKLIETGGVAYRVYQWVPAFAWGNADTFNVVL